MLRNIGLLLAVFSAIGVLTVLHAAVENWGRFGLGRHLLGAALSLTFAVGGLAVSFALLRIRPPKQGMLFWVAVFGAARGASFIVPITVGLALYPFQMVPDLGWMIPLDNWWPPNTSLFHDLLWSTFYKGTTDTYELEFFRTTLGIAGIFRSPLFWVLVPLGLYLWALWGRAVGIADKLCGWVALTLAILMTASAIETAYWDYQRTTVEWPPGTNVSYLYYPAFDWYIFYAIDVLLFTATGLLLLQRRPRNETRGNRDAPPSNAPQPPASP